MPAWLLLAAVLCHLAGSAWPRSSLLGEQGLVYGKVEHPVKIYVKLHQNSPVLFCMDSQRASEETVDPTYLWIGPNEQTLTGNNRISITETGKLTVKDFLELLSGLYTCILSYKTIKVETQEETVVKKRYDFMIFAYREPDYSYQMSVRFTTKSCVGGYNDQLFRLLKKILNNLISDLSCHIIEPSYKCHVVKIPEQDLTRELFIAFQVNPFAPGWKGACNASVDCEDITNRNVLKWFVVLGLSVPMSMSLARSAFLFMSMELNLAHKLQRKTSSVKSNENALPLAFGSGGCKMTFHIQNSVDNSITKAHKAKIHFRAWKTRLVQHFQDSVQPTSPGCGGK